MPVTLPVKPAAPTLIMPDTLLTDNTPPSEKLTPPIVKSSTCVVESSTNEKLPVICCPPMVSVSFVPATVMLVELTVTATAPLNATPAASPVVRNPLKLPVTCPLLTVRFAVVPLLAVAPPIFTNPPASDAVRLVMFSARFWPLCVKAKLPVSVSSPMANESFVPLTRSCPPPKVIPSCPLNPSSVDVTLPAVDPLMPELFTSSVPFAPATESNPTSEKLNPLTFNSSPFESSKNLELAVNVCPSTVSVQFVPLACTDPAVIVTASCPLKPTPALVSAPRRRDRCRRTSR